MSELTPRELRSHTRLTNANISKTDHQIKTKQIAVKVIAKRISNSPLDNMQAKIISN